MIGKVICITNQKGGVGKTSTTESIAACLTKKGYRVLCLDMDPQGNLSFSVDAGTEDFPTIYDVLKGTTKVLFAVQKTTSFDIIASSLLLNSVDLEFTEQDREFILKERLEPAREKYDYILIDTPPALSLLTINAFTAADSIIIPMVVDAFSLQGIAELNETIMRVRKAYNPNLKIEGIVLNKYSFWSRMSKEILATAQMVATDLDTKIFHQKIHARRTISEAQARQMSLLEYAPNSRYMRDTMKLVDEILNQEKRFLLGFKKSLNREQMYQKIMPRYAESVATTVAEENAAMTNSQPQVAPQPAAQPQVAEQPVAQPQVAPQPDAQPQVAEQPVAQPQVAPQPVAQPQVAQQPVAQPQVAAQPVAQPQVAEQPVAQPAQQEEVVTETLTPPSEAETENIDETSTEDNMNNFGIESLNKNGAAKVIVNITAEIVLRRVDKVIESMNFCKCDSCKMDIVAIALNQLPPQYVVDTPAGIEERIENSPINQQVASVLLKAALAVRKEPRH